MKEILERLWNDYLFAECAILHTEEERVLTRKAAKLLEKANALLTEEQKDAVEAYVDAVYDMDALFAKKAFFKGCRFALAFLSEAEPSEHRT